MELASLSFDYAEIFDSWPKSPYSLDSAGKVSPSDSLDAEDAENYAFLESVLKDDKAEFIYHAKRLFVGEDTESHRSEALKLLNACCAYDSLDCASSLVNGDAEWVPYINDLDANSGLSPLHTAAEAHAPRCVEMLLKRRARTDIRSKDGRALLPLELSLCNVSLDVTWNPTGDSIGDLILMLGDKDLTVVRLLAEKKKEVETVAYAYARDGEIVPLTALLLVATDKIREATVALQDADSKVSKPKTTIYETVIQEVLQINGSMESEFGQKRTVLLREIELLQLFGVSEFVDKRTSPLITVVQAGDEAVLELLLNNNIDVNETDAEGNTALQCCLKASSVPHKQQTRIMGLLIAHGARVSQKNKLGLSVVHFAAAYGNLSALEILVTANPDSVHIKTVIKETPLFFAVRNNHLACVELLLRFGASTEIHNLRKQRPIELTQSQDIRFLLNPTNITGFRKETEVAEVHSAVPAKVEETSFIKTPVPIWLKKFVNWLPRYLKDTSKSWGETGYPLSSLKADFRSVFGMDLDHASLGFSKLSDFVRSFPKLCKMEVVPVGKKYGPATHWVISPVKSCQLKERPPEAVKVNLDESISPKKPKASSTTDLNCSSGFIQEAQVSKTFKPEAEGESPSEASDSDHHQLKHPILETLAKIRNSTSIFFLREFDFYQSYETCLKQGICFWCNKSMLLWANFPCGHKLWCSGCKQEVTQSAGRGDSLGGEHRCVVCDAKVERFILFPPVGFDHHRLSSDRQNKAESFLQYLNMKNSLKK